jgi:small-conductance mechanosensitive channel
MVIRRTFFLFRSAFAVIILATIAAGAFPKPALAQRKGADDAGLVALEKRPAVASVVIDGRILFNVRGVTAYPAAERARVIADRIVAAAGDSSVSTASLHAIESEFSTDLFAGDHFLMSVYNADVQIEGAGMARQVLAKLYLQRIKTAIDDYRSERTPDHLFHQILVALGCGLGLAIALTGLFYALQWTSLRIKRKYESAIERVETRAYRLIRARAIWRILHGVSRIASAFAAAALLFIYIHFVLGLLPWTRIYAENFRHLTLSPLLDLLSESSRTVPNLFLIAMIVLAARYLLRLAHLAFNSIKEGHLKIASFDPEWADSTYNIVRILVIAFVVIVCYPFIPGSETPAFKGVTIFIGVLFSLGSSSFLANVIAGYTMTYRRAFRVGDRIRIDQMLGDVTKVGLMVTHLKSIKNEELTLIRK